MAPVMHVLYITNYSKLNDEVKRCGIHKTTQDGDI